jgi:hypothetical protein
MNANENKNSQPTPEQLLKLLDLQLDAMRTKRTAQGNRNAMRIASIMLVVILAAGALFVLMTMLNDMKHDLPHGHAKPAIGLNH